ncbi:TetR/AcrR family transcriptional regulator [Lederbergia graminis]|uniref:TetR/AcrR family transcriptional regulator n=1 Tax=Lederbergia graminis TaxID=735518 RepID=A0ABW0LM14_9BACI|nr:TetR/AcrR family transcriptional regulator [Paenibacillus bovis]
MKRNKPKYMQIIDAAVIVIAENGFHQSQVSKIAKQAGVADGTIYLYFHNKEDILISVFREKMGMFVHKITEEIEKKETASEKLLVLIEHHFKNLSENPKLAIITQLELRQSNKELRQKINDVLKDYLFVVDEVIKYGIERNEFTQIVDVRLTRQMIFGTIDEIITNWVINEQKYDLVELAPAVQRLLLNGCGK